MLRISERRAMLASAIPSVSSIDEVNLLPLSTMKKDKIIEVAVKVVVAALTAFLTAISTTSCMGYGPITL